MSRIRPMRRLMIAAICAAPALFPALRPALAEEPVLTVTGAIENGPRRFTLAELEAMPRAEFDTTTVWTEGTHRFTGVPLPVLLDALGATGGVLRVSAINDYTIELPLDDPTAAAGVLAYMFDGSEMSRRGKGPLWLVWDYDASSEHQTEAVYARSVWQVNRIDVRD